MQKYRAGIIGCGRIAGAFEDDPLREHPCTHAGVYTSLPEIELVAASDVDEARLRTFASRWNIKSVYQDYTKMLEQQNLDIVSICVPTPLHCDAVIKSAGSKPKAIFCEKPIANSLGEADEMIKKCDENGVKLVINYSRRWDPYYNQVKKLINSGAIGDVRATTGHYTSGLLMVGTHMLDIFRYLIGDVVEVAGFIESIDGQEFIGNKPSENFSVTDPSVSGYLNFASGARGLIEGSCRKDYLIFEIDIQGSSGRIRISDNGMNFELWHLVTGKHASGYKELERQPFPSPATTERRSNTCSIASVKEIVACIEQNRQSISSGRDGRANLEIALALHVSSKQGKSIRLPLADKKFKVMSK